MNSKIIKLCPSTYDFEVNNFSHINNTRNDVLIGNFEQILLMFLLALVKIGFTWSTQSTKNESFKYHKNGIMNKMKRLDNFWIFSVPETNTEKSAISFPLIFLTTKMNSQWEVYLQFRISNSVTRTRKGAVGSVILHIFIYDIKFISSKGSV